MSLRWIRRKHGVAAFRGARVRYTDEEGHQFEGKILCSTGQYLRVRFKGFRKLLTCHPVRNLEYLDEPRPVSAKQEIAGTCATVADPLAASSQQSEALRMDGSTIAGETK